MNTVRVGKPKKKASTGEFKVPVYINGKYNEEETYYTTDLSEAVSAMKDMTARFSRSRKYKLVSEASEEFEDDFGKEDDEDMDEKPKKKKKAKKSKKEDDDDEDDFDDEEEPDTMKEDILRLSRTII